MNTWKWRYIYARPLFTRSAAERARQLREYGADERAIGLAVVEGMIWRPWWRRHDGRLGVGR